MSKCPNCGYCPHCGRKGDHGHAREWPLPYVQTQKPIWINPYQITGGQTAPSPAYPFTVTN